MNALLQHAETFDPRGRFLAAARTLLAVAELSLLLGTPSRLLFLDNIGRASDRRCVGVNAPTLWCVTSRFSDSRMPGLVVAVVVLVVVAIGVWPRWLCLPHWYVAFSIAHTVALVDGGEIIASIVVMLMVPMCLGDSRRWQWSSPETRLDGVWSGSAYAAHLILRCQVLVVYVDAALSKLAYPAWRSGIAVGVILNDPQDGAPNIIRPGLNHVLAWPMVNQAATWSVLLIELCIAASMLCGLTIRRRALLLGILLHVAIVALMGLISFGLIMIATLLLVSDGSRLAGDPPEDVSSGGQQRTILSSRTT